MFWKKNFILKFMLLIGLFIFPFSASAFQWYSSIVIGDYPENILSTLKAIEARIELRSLRQEVFILHFRHLPESAGVPNDDSEYRGQIFPYFSPVLSPQFMQLTDAVNVIIFDPKVPLTDINKNAQIVLVPSREGKIYAIGGFIDYANYRPLPFSIMWDTLGEVKMIIGKNECEGMHADDILTNKDIDNYKKQWKELNRLSEEFDSKIKEIYEIDTTKDKDVK